MELFYDYKFSLYYKLLKINNILKYISKYTKKLIK